MKNKSTVENFLTEHDLVLKLKEVTGIFNRNLVIECFKEIDRIGSRYWMKKK
jgi:hypothetical protein